MSDCCLIPTQQFLARLYEVQKSLCRWRPMLTFAFMSNVDKLRGPG